MKINASIESGDICNDANSFSAAQWHRSLVQVFSSVTGRLWMPVILLIFFTSLSPKVAYNDAFSTLSLGKQETIPLMEMFSKDVFKSWLSCLVWLLVPESRNDESPNSLSLDYQDLRCSDTNPTKSSTVSLSAILAGARVTPS